MLKLSIAAALFTSVTGILIDSPSSPIPPNKKPQIRKIISLTEEIQNAIPQKQPNNPSIYQPTPFLNPT